MVGVNGSFQVLCARDPRERSAWIRRWESWFGREVFAHPQYVELFADPGALPLCASWQGEEGKVLYPFILRDLTVEPYWNPSLGPATDIVTPYGYGGAHFWDAKDRQSLEERFWSRFGAWAREHSVVSEFARFSLFSDTILHHPGIQRDERSNVVRDLEPSQESLWMDFKHKVRKNVKRAQRSALGVDIDFTGAKLGDFLRIYQHTMDRRQSRKEYSFSSGFFERIHEGLAGQFAYFHAVHGGRIVSSELVLVSANSVYSFLGGTDEAAFSLRPNDLLKFEIMLWARNQGKRWFVLGGGYEREDGIFRYKAAFAPQGIVPFRVGNRIFRNDVYHALVTSSKELARRNGTQRENGTDYFPAYRG